MKAKAGVTVSSLLCLLTSRFSLTDDFGQASVNLISLSECDAGQMQKRWIYESKTRIKINLGDSTVEESLPNGLKGGI